MIELDIKVGDQFVTNSKDNAYGKTRLIVKKVENSTNVNGWITFDTLDKVHNKKYNHTARVWWFRKECTKVRR